MGAGPGSASRHAAASFVEIKEFLAGESAASDNSAMSRLTAQERNPGRVMPQGHASLRGVQVIEPESDG